MMNRQAKLLVLALAPLISIAAMQPVAARPIQERPVKINSETAKSSCIGMDGVFRYAPGGGFSCTYYVKDSKVVQSCNAKGQCNSTREPYKR
jgi:hypothetical protein